MFEEIRKSLADPATVPGFANQSNQHLQVLPPKSQLFQPQKTKQGFVSFQHFKNSGNGLKAADLRKS